MITAAVATVISQGLSVVLCAVYILKKSRILVPEREDSEYSVFGDYCNSYFQMQDIREVRSISPTTAKETVSRDRRDTGI